MRQRTTPVSHQQNKRQKYGNDNVDVMLMLVQTFATSIAKGYIVV